MALVLLVAAILTESHVRLLIWRKKGLQPVPWRTRILYTLPACLPALAMLLPRYRLLTFYLLYLLLCMGQERTIPTPRQMFHYSVRMRFVFFGCSHLAMLGLLSLVLERWNKAMAVDRVMMLSISMVAALLFSAAIKFTALLSSQQINFQATPEERRDFRHLYWFLNLTMAYLFAQAVLCQFQFPIGIHMSMLLCSNLITLFYISCYLISLTEILKKYHVKNSYDSLSASLIESDQRLRHLRSNAHYDALTGARSRGFARQALQQMVEYQVPFSLIYMDLNGLKRINDTYGHGAGDDYLQQFAAAIQRQIRDDDILARFGGDEFVLILRLCSKENAEKRLAVIRGNLARETEHFGFGAGVVESSEASDLDRLLSLADQRMYGDKKRKEAVES